MVWQLRDVLAAHQAVVRELAECLTAGHASNCGSAGEPCRWAEDIQRLLARPLVVAARGKGRG